MKAETHRAIREVTGRPGSVTCRSTHIYPDGPAPYLAWFAYGDKARIPEQYMAIRKIAEQAMVDLAASLRITMHSDATTGLGTIRSAPSCSAPL